ncbi:MAG: LAGLIDADG family homing endonuclease [Candidatus Micrarchaeales archaeon]
MTGHPINDRRYFEYLWVLEYLTFGKSPHEIKIRSGALRMCLQYKPAYTTLTALGVYPGKGKALNVTIPETLVKKGWKYTKWVLRGIMDTDGTLFFSKKTYKTAIYPTLEISTSSKNLAIQINTLLLEKGFRSRIRKYGRPGGNDEFHVALYGHAMLRKWIYEIGFSNRRHINKLVPRYSMKLDMPQ